MRSRRSAITLLLFSSIVCSSTAAQQRDGASTAEPFSPTGKLSQFRGFASPRPTGQLPFNANFMYASVWAVWSAWSFCVNGQRIRVRACNTVRGFSCLGTNREVQFCDPNDPGVRTQRRRLPNSDYDVVDPWEADRQEAMKQLYTDPETDDDSDMPQLPPKLRRPSGSNSEFRARAAGVQTQSARLVPPHPVAHGHQFTESRRPPNENDGMPGATPEKMFGAKQFALRQKPQNPELQTLRGIGEKSLEGTDAKEKDSPRPLPVADAAPKSTDEPLEVPPSKPINADMDMENGQPLPPLSGEDDVDTSVQLRNEGRQFLSVPGKMDPRTTMRPNPNLVTLKHQRSTTKGSSQPVTVTPSTTVIPPVLSTTTSRRPATVRPVPSIVETAVEDITGEELLSKEESDVVQSFFSNSGVQSRASGLTGGNRKLAKEQLLEKTPAAHSQSSTTVRPPMTSSISPRVSTISNESGEAEATERPQSSDNNDRHSQPVVHQEERFGFNDRELLRHVEEPNEVVDEIGLAAPFPQATRPRQPAQLMDHEEPGLAGPFFPENGLSSQQAQPPGHNELEVPHSEPGLSGPFFPERTEQDRQMIEASLKKFNGRGAALPPSINADKLEQHKSGALPPSASVNVVHAQQRVFPQIQGDARQIKEPHTRSLDPDYSFMNAKVQGDADATQQKPERQKHRSSGDFGLTGMSMKRKQKVLHSGEKPGRILDKYHAASLPPHQSVHQFAAVSAVPPPPPPLDEDIPYKPQFRSSGGPKRRKLRKKIKKIRPARPVPLLAEVFPGSTLAPVQASGYESSALAEVFPTAKTGQHGVQPADLSEDTAKALDWMLKNITKAAEVGDQHFLDQLGVHGAQYLEEKLHLVTAGDLQGGKGVFPQPAAQPYAPAQTPVQASVPAAATSSVRHPPGFGPQTPKKTEVAPARLRLPGISKPKPVGDDDSGYDIKAGVGHDANSRAFGWTSQKHSGEVQEPHVAGESRKKFSKGESGSPYRGKKSRRGGEYAGVTRLRSGVGNRIHGARTMTMDKDDDVPLKLDAPSNIPKDEQGLLEEIRRIEAQMNQMNQDIENFDADLDEPVDDAPVPEAQVPPKYPDDSAKDATQIEIHEFNSMDGRSVKGLKPFSKQNKVMLVEVPEETNIPPRTSSPQSAMDIELAPKNGFVPNKEPVTEDRTPGNPVEPVIMSGRASGSDSEDFWNEWTVWGRCFCGKQVRTRTCNYVEGISLTGCEGNSYETRECEGGPCPAKKQKQKKNKLMVVEVEDTPSDHPRSYTLAPNTRTDRSFFKMHPLNAAQKVPTV